MTAGDVATGYGGAVTGGDLAAAGYVHLDGDADWWIPSGVAVFPANPAAHFYLSTGAVDALGIETTVMPFQGIHEMMMLGTASHNPVLPPECAKNPITSDLTCAEMWNLTNMGYRPLKLVLGTAVYSLGIIGGLKAMLKSLSKGEIHDLTSMIYDAREHAIGLIKKEAAAIGADDVLGIKTYIHEFSGLLEFMAIGTAVKKTPGAQPKSETLAVQAIIRDKDTWISNDDLFARAMTAGKSKDE
jgi:uncharacterized protein YbjQ (UPF0145 family)